MFVSFKADAASEKQFCTLSENYLKRIEDKDHKDALDKIEKLKKEYNSNLASATMDAGNKEIFNRSAMLAELITELTIEIQSAFAEGNTDLKDVNFESICKNKVEIKICRLPTDKRKSVEETIFNYKRAALEIAQVDSKKITDLKLPDLTEEIKKNLTIKEITDEDIRNLTPKSQTAIADSPEQQKRLKDISALYNDEEFQEVEKLKKFIASKYLRECKSKGQKIEIGSCGADSTPPVINLEFPGQNFHILGMLSKKKSNGSTFSRDEIDDYTSVCDSNKDYERYDEICKIIYGEHKASRVVKTPQDWNELHKKYYFVAPDPAHPERVEKIEKQSTGSLLVEGLGPVFQSFVPAWINLIQADVSIYAMTQQAMAIKQTETNIAAMNSMSFYNANYMPTTSSPSLSAGFNFGP